MIRSKVVFIKQKIARMKEDLVLNECFLVFVAQLHKVTVVNTDVEKSLLRSFSSDLESLISNFYSSLVSSHGDTNVSERSA